MFSFPVHIGNLNQISFYLGQHSQRFVNFVIFSKNSFWFLDFLVLFFLSLIYLTPFQYLLFPFFPMLLLFVFQFCRVEHQVIDVQICIVFIKALNLTLCIVLAGCHVFGLLFFHLQVKVFFPADSIYCLESFHFILMDSLANNKFNFGVLEDALIFEGQFCWIQNSWLPSVFFTRFDCVISATSGLPVF